MTVVFNPTDLRKLYTPPPNSSGEDNGQVTIIAGSELFHGAPLLATTLASRIVDMVFFTSPYKPIKDIANKVKSKLFSFIWVPFNEVERYIEKSDAIVIGPGFMRYKTEKNEQKAQQNGFVHFLKKQKYDSAARKSRRITEYLLKEFPHKKWVIDGGSLQSMEASWIPEGAIITPNKKEFQMLFNKSIVIPDSDPESDSSVHEERRMPDQARHDDLMKLVETQSRKYKCIIVLKGPTTIVSDGKETVLVEGGNAGLTKGGTGDVLAGLTVAFLAKNEPLLAACTGSYVIKYAADEIYKERGTFYNADDVAMRIPQTLHELLG